MSSRIRQTNRILPYQNNPVSNKVLGFPKMYLNYVTERTEENKRERKGRDATRLVGLGDLLELGLRLLLVTGVLVRVPPHRQAPVRLLEILIGGVPIHLQYVVVVDSHSDSSI